MSNLLSSSGGIIPPHSYSFLTTTAPSAREISSAVYLILPSFSIFILQKCNTTSQVCSNHGLCSLSNHRVTRKGLGQQPEKRWNILAQNCINLLITAVISSRFWWDLLMTSVELFRGLSFLFCIISSYFLCLEEETEMIYLKKEKKKKKSLPSEINPPFCILQEPLRFQPDTPHCSTSFELSYR